MSARHNDVKFIALSSSDDDSVLTEKDTEANLVDVALESGHGTSGSDADVKTSATHPGSAGEGFSLTQLKQCFVPAFPLHEAFPAWSMQVFSNWDMFLSLGLPGAFSLFLEWGSYEFMAMVSGRLGTVELATHGVYMTTCGIIYLVPQAIADATAVIAGNFLGLGDPGEAKSVIALGIAYDMTIGLCGASVLLFVLRPYWGAIFSSDPSVQAEVYDKMPIMFVYITVDSMKCITLNILRSTGRPQVTMVGNIFCCACIMLPLGWYLAITCGYGLWGVWGAMSVGWLSATLVYMTVLWFTDWEFQAKEAARRIAVAVAEWAEPSKDTTTVAVELSNMYD
jgi:Na+-driven multidrug efflux pump